MSIEKKFASVELMLNKLAWNAHAACGKRIPFNELQSEAHHRFMLCVRDYRKSPTNMRFSTWVYFKTWCHLKTYMTKRTRDRHLFYEEIKDTMMPTPVEFKNSVMDRLEGLSKEAQTLVKLILDGPEPAPRERVSKRLQRAREALAFEYGLDETGTGIIIHEIKAELSK